MDLVSLLPSGRSLFIATGWAAAFCGITVDAGLVFLGASWGHLPDPSAHGHIGRIEGGGDVAAPAVHAGLHVCVGLSHGKGTSIYGNSAGRSLAEGSGNLC